MKNTLLIALLFITSLCTLGSTVYLTESDSISWGIKNDGSTAVVDSSWTNQLRWSDNALPGVDRNYVITDGKLLLSPLCEGWAAADYVYFGGGSLTLMPGATMGIVGGQNSNARGVVSNLYAHGGSTIFYSFEVQTGNMVSMPNSSLTLIGEQSGPPLKLAVTNLTDFWQQRGSMLRMPKISGKSNIEIKWHQGPERFNMIDNFGTHPPAYFSKRYSFEDLTEWSGNFSVLGGIRATEISRQPIAGINFVGNASLGSFSVAMTNSAMISFGSAIEGATTLNVTQPVTMPIDIGGESNQASAAPTWL